MNAMQHLQEHHPATHAQVKAIHKVISNVFLWASYLIKH